MQFRTIQAPPLLPWTIVVPFKGGTAAKSRLGGASGLEPELRHRLALAFLLDTVSAVNAVDDVGCVVVVSSDPRIAVALPGVALVEDPGKGLNAAAASGIEWARAWDAHSPVAVLTGDLPCLHPHDLAAALRLARGIPLCVVPDREGSGTTMISALPGTPITPNFGIDSCRLHRLAGHSVLPVPTNSTIRQDVDTTADLLRALQRGAGVSTELAVKEANFWPPVAPVRPPDSHFHSGSLH